MKGIKMKQKIFTDYRGCNWVEIDISKSPFYNDTQVSSTTHVYQKVQKKLFHYKRLNEWHKSNNDTYANTSFVMGRVK
jgi:hypothetical protein